MSNDKGEEKLTLLDEAIASGNPATMLDSLVRIRADLAERGVCRWKIKRLWPRCDEGFETSCHAITRQHVHKFCPYCGGRIVTEDKGDG